MPAIVENENILVVCWGRFICNNLLPPRWKVEKSFTAVLSIVSVNAFHGLKLIFIESHQSGKIYKHFQCLTN